MNSKEGTSKMRAVVLETRGSEAAILVNDGTVRIARGNFRVGETFEYKEQAKPTKRQWAAAAAAMVILLAGSTGMWIDRNYVTYAEVSLDVNPSIVYTLNKRDRVLGVRAVNEDAQSIVESLAEDNIRFMPLTDAVEKTMALLEDEGYLAEVTDDYVLLNVSADDKERQSRLSGDVENAMVHVKEQDSTLEYRIDHSDRSTAKEAKDSGMSIGRYSIWRDEQGRPNETSDNQDEKNGRVVDVEPAAEQTRKEYERKSVRELLGHEPEQDQESVRIVAGTRDVPEVQTQPEGEMMKPEGDMTQSEDGLTKPQDEPNEPIQPEDEMPKPEDEMTQPKDGLTMPQDEPNEPTQSEAEIPKPKDGLTMPEDGPNEPTKPEDGNHTQPVDEEKPDGNVQEQSEYPQQAVNDQEPAVYGQEQGVEYQGSAVDAHSIDKDHDDSADPPAVEDGNEVFEQLIVTDHEKMPEQSVVIDQPLESDPQDEKQSIRADSAEVIGDKEPSKNEDLPVAEDGEKPGYGDKEPPEDRDMESSVAEDVEMPKGAGKEPSMGDGKEQPKGEDKASPKDADKEPPTDDGKTSPKAGDKSASAGKNKAPSTKGDSKPQDKPQENSRGGKADGNGNRKSSAGGEPGRGGGGNPGGGSNPGGRGNPGGGKGNPGGGGGGQPGGGGNPGGGGPGPR